MKARYISYECSPCMLVESDPYQQQVTQCHADEAQFWGVYGRNPDGTAQHIGDAVSSEDAESITALLNWLIKPEV